MKVFKIGAAIILCLALTVTLYAADKETRETSAQLHTNELALNDPLLHFALIETSDGQPSGAAHAFCLALTAEQIGFAIDTLEALGTAGLLAEGQASPLVSKLQIAQIQLDTENIVAVFQQLESFIRKINFHTKKGKLSPGNGMLLINSTLSVMCRT